MTSARCTNSRDSNHDWKMATVNPLKYSFVGLSGSTKRWQVDHIIPNGEILKMLIKHLSMKMFATWRKSSKHRSKHTHTNTWTQDWKQQSPPTKWYTAHIPDWDVLVPSQAPCQLIYTTVDISPSELHQPGIPSHEIHTSVKYPLGWRYMTSLSCIQLSNLVHVIHDPQHSPKAQEFPAAQAQWTATDLQQILRLFAVYGWSILY